MNSAFIHCSQKTGQQLRLNKKKKKRRENIDAARLSAIETYTMLPLNWTFITETENWKHYIAK